MNKMNKKTFDEAINKGLASGSWEQLNDWVVEESGYTFNFGSDGTIFNAGIYDKILSLMNEPSFVKSSVSSGVFKMFEYDWSSFSEDQKNKLRTALTKVYSELTDPLSWFIIIELLGEYYADADALDELEFLKRTVDDQLRSLVPMGFEKLAIYGLSDSIKSDALVELTSMQDDVSEQVRLEVEISLERLSN